jgi:hypothetical protein
MMMVEKLIVLNHIHHKDLFHCTLKSNLVKEQICVMIQLKDKKKCLKLIN